MADTYYAWTRFDVERNEWGIATKTINRGDTVTAKDLGVSDEEFQALVDGGSVRNYGLPEDMPENWTGSPADWIKERNRRMLSATAEGVLSVEEVNTGNPTPSESFNAKATPENEKAAPKV